MGQQEGHDEAGNTQASNYQVKNTLKQEITILQEQLHDQFVTRCALEKALSFNPFFCDIEVENSIPKAAKELIEEILVLEWEVFYLEKYLLSLYRKTLDPRISSWSTIDEKLKATSMEHEEMFPEIPGQDIISEKENPSILSSGLMSSSTGHSFREFDDIPGSQKPLDSSICRSHSSLSQRSACSVRKDIDSNNSLTLSMLEQAHLDAANEQFETSNPDRVLGTPNFLSEEMIKCISAIYCELADPPLINHDHLSSPILYSSDLTSSQGQGDMGSLDSVGFSSLKLHCDNPFGIGKFVELSGPYCTMAKVQWIYRDSKKLKDIEPKVQHYKSLVYQLEEVDLRRMEHKEKLAFWINVHNSLVMHAFLVYGIPKNNLKRISLSLKAAYNIGGQVINVDIIQSSILGCRLPSPGQWLQFLFPSKTRVKIGDTRRAYAIEHPEPLLYFALCLGSYSDPAVRIYTPKKVFQELEAAKEEYIQSNFSFYKDKKILLPKIMESFAKDSDICPVGLLQMVEELIPQSMRKNIQQFCHRKPAKNIEWIPHNFAFQYLLSRDLVSDVSPY